MKKYYSIAFCLFSTLFIAQQAISFEENEGFVTGDIHGQGAWISTPTGGTPANVTHQTICIDAATEGNNSLKIVKESMFGTQPEPIIGGFYNLTEPLIPANFSVSFDINMSQLNGSVFGFQGVNNVDESFVVRVDFDNTGGIKVLNKVSDVPALVSTVGAWSPNTWYRFKVLGTAMEVKYYLNDALIYTSAVADSLTMDQLRFVHNNALGIAYIDNIKVNGELVMSVKESNSEVKAWKIYPNPTTDFIKISTPNRIKNIEVYDLAGKRMDAKWNGDQIDVGNLPAGEYLLSVKTEGKDFTERFIKK